MLSSLPRESRVRSASERTHRAAVRPDGNDRPEHPAVPPMLTGGDAALSKTRRGTMHGSRAAALARWGCSWGTAACLLAALEVLARLHGSVPARPAPIAGQTLALVRLPAVPSPSAEHSRPAPPPPRHTAVRESLPAATAAPEPAPATTAAPVRSEPAAAVPAPRPVAVPAKPPPAPSMAASTPAVAPPGEDPIEAEPPARPAAPAGPPRLVSERSLDPGFRPLSPLRPRYPQVARNLGRSGAVEVDVVVAPDGSIADLAVHEQTPGWGFGAAAREALTQLRFTPPRVDGEPVRVRWRKILRFRP